MYKLIMFNDDGMTRFWEKATHIFKIEKQDDEKWGVTEITYRFDSGETVKIPQTPEDEEGKEEIKIASKALYKLLGQEQNNSRKAVSKRLYLEKHNMHMIPLDGLTDDSLSSASSSRLMEIEKVELKLSLEEAISKLPIKQQRVIKLRYFEEIATCEIAGSEGVKDSAISHRERRALENLKNILSEHQLRA